MITYNFKIGKQFNHIWPLLLNILLTVIVGYYLATVNYGTPPYALYIIWIVGHMIPTILIHANYFFINQSDRVLYEAEELKVHFVSKSQHLNFYLEEIKYATVYQSFALHKGNIQLLSWDSYNHMIIELNNGTKIVLTSLLMGVNNPLPIPEEKIIVKMNFFRWASGPSIKLSK